MVGRQSKSVKAAEPFLKVLLETWCKVVIYSVGDDSREIISEKLDMGSDTLNNWLNGKNIATYEMLNKAARHALDSNLIPEELNQLILDVYKDFLDDSKHRSDFWEMIRVLNSYEKYILKVGKPKLVDQLNKLGCLVYGPGECSSEFGSWLDKYKPFYLAFEEQNLDEYIGVLALKEYDEQKKRYRRVSLNYIPKTYELKKMIDYLNEDREEIKKIIKEDIVRLMARIAEKTNNEYTSGQIAYFAGQHYSMGKFLAGGEVIPKLSVYRNLEIMAGYSLEQLLGLEKLSPISLGRIAEFGKSR